MGFPGMHRKLGYEYCDKDGKQGYIAYTENPKSQNENIQNNWPRAKSTHPSLAGTVLALKFAATRDFVP